MSAAGTPDSVHGGLSNSLAVHYTCGHHVIYAYTNSPYPPTCPSPEHEGKLGA